MELAYDYAGYSAWNRPQPVNALVSVTGIEGARAYQLPPNSSVPLFDANTDTLFVKTTDGAGFPTIRVFRFEEVKPEPPQTAAFVTQDEFDRRMDELKELISGKQSVRKPTGKQPEPAAE